MKNKKMILLLVLTLLLSVFIMGCSKDDKDESVNVDENVISDEVIKEDENEDLEVEGEIVDIFKAEIIERDNESYTLKIEATEDNVISTGMDYTIEKENENGEWEALDLELAFTMQLITINKDNPFSQDIDVGEFEPGIYRLNKNIFNEVTDNELQVISLQFEIHEETK